MRNKLGKVRWAWLADIYDAQYAQIQSEFLGPSGSNNTILNVQNQNNIKSIRDL